MLETWIQSNDAIRSLSNLFEVAVVREEVAVIKEESGMK